MRVIVTGSRSWDLPEIVNGCLDIIAKQAAEVGDELLVVVHGACFPRSRTATGGRPLKSADYLAYLWTRRPGHPLNVVQEPWPAKWKEYGRKAGRVRNSGMAALGADLCMAFHRDESPGTAHMIRVAEEAEIPTKVVDYPEADDE